MHSPVTGGSQLLWIVGQPHGRQSSRRIHLRRRSRKRNRDGIVCISGIVESHFFTPLEVNRIDDAIRRLHAL
jgi:hypothetical protein